MLKALLKKQFLELNTFYLFNKKTGKRRSKASSIAFIALFVFIFLAIGFSFFGVSALLAPTMVSAGLDWLFFALMGMMAIFLGVFGSVFNTYSGLYQAKDNDLLLSMPIPSSMILTVRMTGVYAMSLLYESMIFIPAIIGYCVFGSPSACSIVFSLLLIFVLGFLILTLTCILGWLVAVISSKLKNKSIITVFISLAFFAVYYYVCFNFNSLLTKLAENSESIGFAVKNAAYPIYLMGLAAAGSPLAMLLFTLMVAAVTALTVFILSKTFTRIVTVKGNGKRIEYKEKAVRVSGSTAALFRRELKHYLSSSAYMLNCSLTTFLAPILAVLAIIFREKIFQTTGMLGLGADFISIAALFAVCLLSSMNDLTPPSVSLEGKSIWIMQSLPVDANKVLDAKQYLHWVLTIPPCLILYICISFVLGISFSTAVLSSVFIVLYIMLFSALGLIINLKRPNLNWSSETIPVKQSMGIMICLFGGWIISVGLIAAGYFAINITAVDTYITVLIVLFALITRFLNSWLRKRGPELFGNL